MALPVYRLSLNPHSIFHWVCHSLGLYYIQSESGLTLQFHNSIQLPLSMFQNSTNIRRYFLAYLFSDIQSCTSEQVKGRPCQCQLCSLYMQQSAKTLQMILQEKQYSYREYLQRAGIPYTIPFFMYQDFGIERKIPTNIVLPDVISTFVLCAVGS